MSYCRTSVRSRALVPTALGLALAVGPLAVLAPTGAPAVTTPTHADVTLANAADALAYDDGRLLTNSGPGGSRTVRVDTVTVPVPGQVTIATGSATYAPSHTNSGERHTFATSAGVDLVGTAGRVVAKRGSTTLLDVPAPSGNAWSVDLSGPYARIGNAVRDLRRPAAAVYTLPTTTAASALYGSRLVWSERDGSVRYRDVATHAATRTLRAGTNGCTTCAFQVGINGSTVAYGRTGGWLALWDAGSGLSAPNAVSLIGVERFRIGDGFVVAAKSSGVDLYRLNDPLTPSIGEHHLDGTHVVDLAVDGHSFAYLRADGSVTVAQLPDAVDGERRPLVLASEVPGAFSPNGDGVRDSWTPSFVLTQPVSTWRLQIVDRATNSPVATLGPGAVATPTASISTTWKPPGSRAQGGYRWNLDASNADGSALSASGLVVQGVVNLLRKNVRTSTVTAPANVATATRSLRTTVSWKPAGAFPSGVSAASWDVQVRTVRVTKKNKRAYGKAERVLYRTTKSSTTFGGKRGATYQFRARNKDSVGLVGPWSKWTTSTTPLDDRSSALKYSSGWKNKRMAGPWGGTLRVAKASGSSVQLAGVRTSGFALVMRTCASCGSVKVIVDGKRRATVKLNGTGAQRRQVWAISFKKPGKHTLRVVTKNKKTVYLDAVVVRR